MKKRYEVNALKSYDKDVFIIGTAHNERERLTLVFEALKAGFDYIICIEY